MLGLIFLWASFACADDILLETAAPILGEPSYAVQTFYREGSNDYYFTVVFQIARGIRRLHTQITFNSIDAAHAHNRGVNWLRDAFQYSHSYGNGVIPEQQHEICPFELTEASLMPVARPQAVSSNPSYDFPEIYELSPSIDPSFSLSRP